MKNNIWLLPTRICFLHWWCESLHSIEFNSRCRRNKLHELYIRICETEETFFTTNWNSSSVIGSLLVQVFASSEQVITPIPCRTSQENLAQSSMHPSTTACRHITHLALNLRGCQQCRHSSETEDVLWKQLEALLRPVLVNPPLPCQFSSARICLHKLLQPSPKSSSGEGEILTP